MLNLRFPYVPKLLLNVALFTPTDPTSPVRVLSPPRRYEVTSTPARLVETPPSRVTQRDVCQDKFA